LAVGSWQLAVGSWQLAVGKDCKNGSEAVKLFYCRLKTANLKLRFYTTVVET